jgi:16S rRNA (uracil1498-N3)-methyltransferase
MNLFYTPDIFGSSYTLNEEEFKHCIRVLRMKTGNEICLVDGKGGYYKGIIVSINPKSCNIEIIESIPEFEKRGYYFHLAIAPTKNTDRIEWLVEKAVEIGIDELTPIICEHSERKNFNTERIERIAIAAMKQSVKAFKPKINQCVSFKNFINSTNQQVKLIAHCSDENRKKIKNVCKTGQSVVCLIGPEGDFSENEIQSALKLGFVGVSLGQSRLRTETAGLVACHTISLLNF